MTYRDKSIREKVKVIKKRNGFVDRKYILWDKNDYLIKQSGKYDIKVMIIQ